MVKKEVKLPFLFMNADLNAAAAGLAVLACGEMMQSGHSMKQEPTEGKHSVLSEPVGVPVL